MATGTVKWFNAAKGYGSIGTAAGDVYVHRSAIQGGGFQSLTEGQQVEVEAIQGSRGLEATRVRAI